MNSVIKTRRFAQRVQNVGAVLLKVENHFITQTTSRLYGINTSGGIPSTLSRNGNETPPSFGFRHLDTNSIDFIKDRLDQYIKTVKPIRYKYVVPDSEIRQAAVAALFCNSGNEISLIFTERSDNLRSHKGEVCFPGGKKDESDGNLFETAARETYEEIGIPIKDIHFLGNLHPLPNKQLKTKVHPIIGYINHNFDDLQLKINEAEVKKVYTLPLSWLYDPKNHVEADIHQRLGLKYNYRAIDNVIWGLTAFILKDLLQILSK